MLNLIEQFLLTKYRLMNRFSLIVILLLISVTVGAWNLKKQLDDLDSYVSVLEKNQESLMIKNIKKNDLNWLALNIYHEARGEGLEGMFAVGVVTLNRVKSDKYPNTIAGVVKQRNQFSWYWDGQSDKVLEPRAWETSKSVAKILLTDDKLKIQKRLKGVVFYHAAWVNPSWSKRVERVATIGNHIFYM
jgi:spore germination cell wall hydrolase CwlJ-like protein